MNRIIVVILLILFFSPMAYAQTQTAYNPAKDPKHNLGEGSNVNFGLSFRYGTDGVSLWFGTETCNGVGTSGVVVGTGSTQPRMHVTHNSGSTTVDFQNVDVMVDGSELATLGNSIAANNGYGTDTYLYNPEFAGSGTLSPGFSLSTDGVDIEDSEIAFLDGLYGKKIQEQLNERVGSSTPRIAAITCGGTSTATNEGSTTVNFQGGGDITTTIIDNGNGLFTLITALTGTSTAKPDIKEGTTTVGFGAAHLSFDPNEFDIVVDGTGVSIQESLEQKGTTTPASNYVAKGDNNGKLNTWVDRFVNVMTFDATGTFTPSVSGQILAEVWGAGAGGADGGGGGGGGGGGYAKEYLDVIEGVPVSCIVGLGGSAGSNGNPGGTSTVHAWNGIGTRTVSAEGGRGGLGSGGDRGGRGGTGSGTVSMVGGNGQGNNSPYGSIGGRGANGGDGGKPDSGGTQELMNGTAPGGGGSDDVSGTGILGGNGANGRILIWY